MRTLLVAFIGGIVGTVFTSMMVLAWAGPTSAPPNGNVSAPINVGSVDQVKNAGLALNSLAVFGNQLLSGASRYINFGSTAGSGGYGIRDNAGAMQFKNSNGSWSAFLPSSGVASITFADGTTQTTAATGARFDTTFTVNPTAGGGYMKHAQCPNGSVMIGINMTPAGTGDSINNIICQSLN